LNKGNERGIKMGIKDIFSNRTETGERHRIETLRTRYYKTNKSKAMKTAKDLIETDPRVRLLNYSEDHGEITAEFIKPKKAFMVVSIITVFPFRTAIDFTITTKTTLLPMDGGFSKREVLTLYKKLDQQLEFAGVGLSEGG
jgi:hypothetical protein